MLSAKNLIIVIVAVALAAMRILGIHSRLFATTAHLFTGGLVGAYVADRTRKVEIWSAVAISLVELAVFLITRR